MSPVESTQAMAAPFSGCTACEGRGYRGDEPRGEHPGHGGALLWLHGLQRKGWGRDEDMGRIPKGVEMWVRESR